MSCHTARLDNYVEMVFRVVTVHKSTDVWLLVILDVSISIKSDKLIGWLTINHVVKVPNSQNEY